MPTSFAACAAARSHGCVSRSSRSRPTRSDGSCVSWHGIGSVRRGADALLDAIEQLQGAPLTASVLEREILPARVGDYQPAMLDALMAAGEVVWVGVEPLGDRDGRIALYLTDHLATAQGPVTRRPDDKSEATPRGRCSRHPRISARTRRVVLCRHPSRHRRGLSAGNGRRAVGSRLAGPGHQRHTASRCAR